MREETYRARWRSSTLRGAEVIFAVSFLPRLPADRCVPFLLRARSCHPCNRDPLLPQPPACRRPGAPLPPSVIGNPIKRNLSNPPTQTTSISLETAPSTTNHAFTQTALIPRGLFFKIVTSLLFGTPHLPRAHPCELTARIFAESCIYISQVVCGALFVAERI